MCPSAFVVPYSFYFSVSVETIPQKMILGVRMESLQKLKLCIAVSFWQTLSSEAVLNRSPMTSPQRLPHWELRVLWLTWYLHQYLYRLNVNSVATSVWTGKDSNAKFEADLRVATLLPCIIRPDVLDMYDGLLFISKDENNINKVLELL